MDQNYSEKDCVTYALKEEAQLSYKGWKALMCQFDKRN